jgi:hypothetical protein
MIVLILVHALKEDAVKKEKRQKAQKPATPQSKETISSPLDREVEMILEPSWAWRMLYKS